MVKMYPQLQVYWNIHWLRRSVISSLISLLILLMIPVIIQYGLIHIIKKQGATEVQIEDINLNPFAGTFELKQLKVTTDGYGSAQLDHISADVDMLELFSSRVVVNDLLMTGLEAGVLRADNGDISINGLAVYSSISQAEKIDATTQDQSEAIAYGVKNLRLENIDVTYQEPGFKQLALIQTLKLMDISSWDKSSTAHLELKSKLNDAVFILSADMKLFNPVMQFKGKSSIDSLAFKSFNKFYRDHVANLQGSISVDSIFDISISDSVVAKVSNKVEINDLDVAYQHIHHATQNIVWQGDTSLSEDGQITIKGDLSIRQSRTTDNKQDYLISSFGQINLSDFQKNQESISFGELEIEDALLIEAEKDKRFVTLDKLKLQQLALLPGSSKLDIGQISLNKPQISLTISKNGQLENLTPLFKTIDGISFTAESAQAEDKTSVQKPYMINIGKLALLQPGTLNFSDKNVSPNYKTTFTFDKIDIQNISSEKSARFDLALKQGKYTSFNIKGEGLLFDPVEKLKMTAQIKQLDLPPITPYTSNAMGYGMKSGVVDADIELTINQREIDSIVDLKIDSIEVIETNSKTAEQVTSASGMSIDLAVSTLKDSDNIIELKLPVKGNIDQPDFDLSHIVNSAMGKAMKSASLTYLKHSLQPFGSLITLFKLAKSAANHISLPPVLFETNSLVLKDQQQDLLDKVIKVLNERPGLKIKACGISALDDQLAIKEALLNAEIARVETENNKVKKKKEIVKIIIPEDTIQQKMRELADQRSEKIKRLILTKGKLEPSRILNCLSSFNLNEESQASVELSI